MNWSTILKAAGSGLAAAASEIEGSAAGHTVAAEAKKTLSDAANDALGYVKQNAAPAATKALSAGLSKVGVPSAVADLLADLGVTQGETFLTQLASAI